MIKVCQVVSDTNIGGAGRCLLNYLKYYDRNAYKVSVIVPENSQLTEFIKEYDEVTIFEVPYMADKSFDKRAVSELKKIFLKEKFDILHTHASLSARIAGRRAKIKTILSTRHCIESKGKMPMSLAKSVLNNLLCDYYIAVSDAVAENLKDCGISNKKIKTVYNGVEPVEKLSDEEIKEVKKKYNLATETVFGIFARLEEVKGHRYFIEAAKKYLAENGNGVFLIVGDGSLMGELKELSEDSPKIIFTGYQKNTKELLNITDVNVISSSSEAMCLAILEAMSLGKPTIATNVGGNPQLITNNENGILTEYADVSELKNAFVRLTEDKELYKKLSEKSEKLFFESFTAEKMVEELEKLYWEVSNEKR